MLRDLTTLNVDDLPLLTLSRADEKDSAILPREDNKTEIRETIQMEMFSKARNFK